MTRWWSVVAVLAGCVTTGGVRREGAMGPEKALPSLGDLEARRAEFVDVEIAPDEAVSEKDLEALRPLVRAAMVMDRLFWRQASEDGLRIRQELASARDEYGKVLRDLVEIHYGPYDRLRGHEPFLEAPAKPLGATFYPPDMTREEFEDHLRRHPEDREAFESPFTVVRRDERGRLRAIPYSEFYREDLAEAARLLREAASLTRDLALARFLASRADAFEFNDFYQSDLDWMDLGTATEGEPSDIEVTIGPYEVYEDRLFNLKAAFEAFVTVRDRAESEKLARVTRYLDEIEANLPVDDRHKNYSRGAASPISVVQVVLTAGDTRAGVQTTAFNLPNDERVRAAKGSKKVLLKNVGQAKFRESLIPIARTVLDPALMRFVDFDAYFNDVLMHEVSHGLGPGIIARPDGTKTTVNAALRETYSAIEECKADVVGIFATLWLIERGVFPRDLLQRTMATYLAGIFRSVRFGIDEAHGRANIVEFNFLRRAGAFTHDPATGRFGVDEARFPGSIRDLARALLTLEAEGDHEGATRFLAEYGGMPDEVARALARLRDVPVDIRPRYPLGEELLGGPPTRRPPGRLTD